MPAEETIDVKTVATVEENEMQKPTVSIVEQEPTPSPVSINDDLIYLCFFM